MNLKLLSSVTFCPPDELYVYLEHPKYSVFELGKKTGGTRTIHAPAVKLKHLQKLTNTYLSGLYAKRCHPAAYGFIKKRESKALRTIVTNAAVHTGKKYVWNIDLEDFFHSLNTRAAWNALVQFGIHTQDALPLALLCCYEKKLPMGAPTSPVISNMACTDMDWKLKWYCEDRGITYTRYADDLTFSCDVKIEQQTRQEIISIVSDFGFRINARKERMQSCYGAQWVTGIKVNEKPNVCRTYIRTLRAILHNVEQHGIGHAAERYFKTYPRKVYSKVEYFKQSVSGKINYVGFVKGKYDPVYLNLLRRWEALMQYA
ncbi:MAG: reverse transcriptase family protein [Bacteroidota bacterium]